jgi:NADH:ubiquinone oxidoreductase subunit E
MARSTPLPTVADHVTANRLAENLAVERRHAFDVAGRDAQHIGKDPRAASIEALKIVQKQRGWVPDGAIYAIADVLGLLVLNSLTLCRTQLKSLGLWLLILVHN